MVGIALAGAPLLLMAAYHGARGVAVEPFSSQAAALRRLALEQRNGIAFFAVADGVLGLCFFANWVLYRERSLAVALAWAAAIALTGFGGCRHERVTRAALVSSAQLLCTLGSSMRLTRARASALRCVRCVLGSARAALPTSRLLASRRQRLSRPSARGLRRQLAAILDGRAGAAPAARAGARKGGLKDRGRVKHNSRHERRCADGCRALLATRVLITEAVRTLCVALRPIRVNCPAGT